ncbi:MULTISPECIES: ATP-dependent protease ATPase subunit HslU [Thermotoga]|jgi:ATP-dependent HslUV protease ATP-binding subunit HslU|uniref:ATP-dependent protease ATPase subunit HslU n=2 Tax=Thermotoga TaxID=2335 RepID=HSLU_THESQ|nr:MULTISPECIES: ATP-dependent protease ATPase subunit HslU [unclassified Thermotoga]B1L8X3.1 RecName: Full=ATP-dependent protease ATPase subunit HslU; AltName: Full=Unfoldase HslU [Thermotoga sp. RQ2]KUK23456.1 MAG: ATP-dependent protease ATPase subunit HslU [Thermotoga petrophila]KUK33444.1 MAG: ATP-dependent protease ATPase subunit HslU [Thermotoga sp. 47_83]MBZ4662109.1 heat shock protein HslVU, ATPase subunit HslU [Thermotoga sp.]ACB08771.1 heat shock protein HslVU, ATPase subunit HslU [T
MKSFDEMTPKEIVQELDKYIVGQYEAKKAVAIAVRNRIRRQKLPEEWRKEVLPKNILMIGPTGVGKTEIARRLAQLSGSPFLKVEATRFTEVGYVGKNVDSMIRDLVEISVNMVKQEKIKEVERQAEELVEERILDALVPESKAVPVVTNPFINLITGGQQQQYTPEDRRRFRAKREEMREKLRKGELENEEIEIELEETVSPFMGIFGPGMEDLGIEITNMFSGMLPKQKKKRKMKVSEARKVLLPLEAEKLIDMDKVVQEALDRAQNRGIIFIDEIDKIAGKESAVGPDVSRQGVQRDLLPIVEGTTIMTKYGPVRTDYILFIAAGAFHVSRPSDLIPELQGRFPIRVELSPLTEEDFVRILKEPENAIIKQYQALLSTEGVELVFTEDGIREMARIAYQLNQRLENIGARRLYTVAEKVLEEISFEAPDIPEKRIVVDAEYVRRRLERIVQDEDLSAYIL